MSDHDHDLKDKLDRLRAAYIAQNGLLADLETTQAKCRDTIHEMRDAVKTEVGKLSGLRFTSYKDAIEWLTTYNAMRTEKQAP